MRNYNDQHCPTCKSKPYQPCMVRGQPKRATEMHLSRKRSKLLRRVERSLRATS